MVPTTGKFCSRSVCPTLFEEELHKTDFSIVIRTTWSPPEARVSSTGPNQWSSKRFIVDLVRLFISSTSWSNDTQVSDYNFNGEGTTYYFALFAQTFLISQFTAGEDFEGYLRLENIDFGVYVRDAYWAYLTYLIPFLAYVSPILVGTKTRTYLTWHTKVCLLPI